MKYVFGPLQSRRLGVSLGIGLIPAKTCNLNCIYCEANATTHATNVRREYVPTDAVIRELDETLKNAPALDSITFSGAGEPTLHNGIGKIVDFLKTNHPRYRVTLLTNGLLLGDPVLQRELNKIDLVIPSLDASCQEEFDAINRPDPPVRFDDAVAALADFTAQASCPVYLELFIVPGINDSDASIARFAKIVAGIKPAKVQLNSLDRPGVDPALRPAPESTIRRFLAALGPVAPEVEAIRRA
ncbi:MAG: radical SAM protein [Victivallaceae bacterium]|nr:radical SAM protein [Victivallaceae bacterium]